MSLAKKALAKPQGVDEFLDFSAGRDLTHLHEDESHFSEGEFRQASFTDRLVAAVIDLSLFKIGVTLVLALLGITTEAAKVSPFSGLVNFGIYLIVVCLPLYSGGQTFGKKMMKIHVICLVQDGVQVDLSLRQVLVREVLGKFISTLVLFLGFFWAIWDKNGQAWHDKISKTRVVMLEGNMK
jgi:uncharacterized RDD family membrane protein YckC